MYLVGARITSGEGAIWGVHLLARCEVQGISGMRQSYSVGDSNDAAFCCHFCSNLLLLLEIIALDFSLRSLYQFAV